MESKLYDGLTARFLASVAMNMPKLSGDVMQGWITNPRDLQKVLRRALYAPWLCIWKTIKLGTFKTVYDVRQALEKNGYEVTKGANDILGNPAFTVATEETEVNLVKVSVAGLGFNGGARISKIYSRAKQLGLKLCPAEVGPQLRLQYKNQPCGEWFLIGMKPIAASSSANTVFDISNFGGGPSSRLDENSGEPDELLSSGTWLVFISSRK